MNDTISVNTSHWMWQMKTDLSAAFTRQIKHLYELHCDLDPQRLLPNVLGTKKEHVPSWKSFQYEIAPLIWDLPLPDLAARLELLIELSTFLVREESGTYTYGDFQLKGWSFDLFEFLDPGTGWVEAVFYWPKAEETAKPNPQIPASVLDMEWELLPFKPIID